MDAGKLWIEAVNVEVGINQYGIMWLVMGAAAEKLYSKYNLYNDFLYTLI